MKHIIASAILALGLTPAFADDSLDLDTDYWVDMPKNDGPVIVKEHDGGITSISPSPETTPAKCWDIGGIVTCY